MDLENNIAQIVCILCSRENAHVEKRNFDAVCHSISMFNQCEPRISFFSGGGQSSFVEQVPGKPGAAYNLDEDVPRMKLSTKSRQQEFVSAFRLHKYLSRTQVGRFCT